MNPNYSDLSSANNLLTRLSLFDQFILGKKGKIVP